MVLDKSIYIFKCLLRFLLIVHVSEWIHQLINKLLGYHYSATLFWHAESSILSSLTDWLISSADWFNAKCNSDGREHRWFIIGWWIDLLGKLATWRDWLIQYSSQKGRCSCLAELLIDWLIKVTTCRGWLIQYSSQRVFLPRWIIDWLID